MAAKRTNREPGSPETSKAEEGATATPEAQPARRSRAPRGKKVEAKPAAPATDDAAGDERDEGAEGESDDATEVVAEVVPEIVDESEEEPADDGDDVVAAPRRTRPTVSSDESSKEVAVSRYDPMQAYMREIERHPVLSPEAQTELATRYLETGDVRAAHKLVTSNLRLVVKIAYEYRRAYKNILDLVQEGNVGLMQAVKKYDPTRGVKLSSYAALWIRAYITRYLLNNWRLVKLGTTQAQRRLFYNLNKEKQKLLAMGIDPSPKLIAERLKVEEREVVEMDVRLGSSEASLDAPVGGDDGKLTARVDLMAAAGEAADDQLAEAELNSKLKGKLQSFRETLKGKELEIFDLRLVATDEPLTLQELGDRFGVSRERVRQLEARLVGKLRQHLREELEEQSRA
jgi:RNA polymerase sigma-32 factor